MINTNNVNSNVLGDMELLHVHYNIINETITNIKILEHSINNRDRLKKTCIFNILVLIINIIITFLNIIVIVVITINIMILMIVSVKMGNDAYLIRHISNNNPTTRLNRSMLVFDTFLSKPDDVKPDIMKKMNDLMNEVKEYTNTDKYKKLVEIIDSASRKNNLIELDRLIK
jgi:hypothetical protein